MPIFGFFRRRAFRKAFREAVKDGALSDAEKAALSAHQVEPSYIDEVRRQHFLDATAPLRQTIETARRMSPEQEAELVTQAERLEITPDFGGDYEAFRDLWLAENEGRSLLRPIDPPMNLKRGESCYFAMPATWRRLKTIRQRIGYAGFSTSIRIVRGVSFRVGNVNPRYEESEELVDQAEGTLAITGSRVIFHGDRKSTTIALGRILAVEPFDGGLEISKASGPNEIFALGALATDLATAVLEQVLAQE
jgi:hypothetical protein